MYRESGQSGLAATTIRATGRIWTISNNPSAPSVGGKKGVTPMRDVLQIDQSRDVPTVRRWTVGSLALEVVIDNPDDGPVDVSISARWYR